MSKKFKVELTKNELELISELLREKSQSALENWKASIMLSKRQNLHTSATWHEASKYQALLDIIKYYLGQNNDIDKKDLELLHSINDRQ